MQRARKLRIWALIVVGVGSVALAAARLLLRRSPPQTALDPAPAPAAVSAAPEPVALAKSLEKGSQSSALSFWSLLAGGIGALCLIVAQSLLLGSRNPLAPSALFAIGIILVQPLIGWAEARHSAAKSPILRSGSLPHFRNFADMASIRKRSSRDAVWIIVLTAAAILLQAATLPPERVLAGQFQPLASVIAMLVVPVVYVSAYVYGDRTTAVAAAGCAAVSGWTLALGKAEPIYPALAVFSSLFLLTLPLLNSWIGALLAGLLILIGGLLSPDLLILALLPVVGAVLRWLDERQNLRRLFFHTLIVLAVAAALWLPSLSILQSGAPELHPNPQLSMSEGLFTSLLMFNLTSDPNPMHGVVEQPVFAPITAAAFLIGLLGIAWRFYFYRRWSDLFLLCALPILLLPSATSSVLPASYPDLRRAALALPVALIIAGQGTAYLAHGLAQRLGRWGVIIATTLGIAALWLLAAEARGHYSGEFIPAYERGLPIIEQLSNLNKTDP